MPGTRFGRVRRRWFELDRHHAAAVTVTATGRINNADGYLLSESVITRTCGRANRFASYSMNKGVDVTWFRALSFCRSHIRQPQAIMSEYFGAFSHSQLACCPRSSQHNFMNVTLSVAKGLCIRNQIHRFFTRCLDSFLLVARSLGYAAWLLRPQALVLVQNDTSASYRQISRTLR